MENGGLGFWPRAAPPPARGGPCSYSVPPAARAARPPGAWWLRGLVVCGRARRGPPWSASAGCGRARRSGAAAPRPGGRQQGAGPAGLCGPPAVRVEAVPPWRRGGFWWLPAAPGVAASPGPSPARPRLWSMLGGAPQPPGGRVGGVPPVVLFGLVPGRRFALAPPSPRGRKGGGHVGPPPSGANAARGAGVWIPPPAGGGERPGA